MKFSIYQRSFFFCILFLCNILSAFGQVEAESNVLQGLLLDQQTQFPLAYANIYNHTTDQGTISDESGYFLIPLSAKEDSIEISFIGYRTLTLVEPFEQKQRFYLEPYAMDLGTVVVTADTEDDSWKWIKEVKKAYQPEDFSSKVYYQMKSFIDQEQVELVEAYYNGSFEGVDINQLKLKCGRSGIQAKEGRYFVNLESSTALASQLLFNHKTSFPSTPFSISNRKMKRIFKFWTKQMYANEKGDSIRVVRFVPRSEQRENFSGSAFIDQKRNALIRLDLEIEDAVLHPFQPIFPDDQLRRVGMHMKRVYRINERNQSEFEQLDLKFTIDYVSNRSTLESNPNAVKAYEVECRAVLQAYDRNTFELPAQNLPDVAMYDYILFRTYPHNFDFWAKANEFSVEDYQGANQAFYDDSSTFTNRDLRFYAGKAQKKTPFVQYAFKTWQPEERVFFKEQKQAERNYRNAAFISDIYDVEAVFFIERNRLLLGAEVISETMLDPFRSFYRMPLTAVAHCFLNIYFDLAEIERRKFMERYDSNWSEVRFLKAYEELVQKMEQIKQAYFAEVDRGQNLEALAKWNDRVKEELGIDNMSIFLSEATTGRVEQQ
jgi:hypothetical protein